MSIFLTADFLGLPLGKSTASEDTPLIGTLEDKRTRRVLQVVRQGVLFLFVFLVTAHASMMLVQRTWWSTMTHENHSQQMVRAAVVSLPSSSTLRGNQTLQSSVKEAEPERAQAKPVRMRIGFMGPSVADPKSMQEDPLLAYRFAVKSGGNNYANCDGLFIMARGDDYELNGKPYYVNPEKDRFLGWTGALWEITAMGYLPQIKKHHATHGFWPGSFGGFHAGAKGAVTPDGVWDDYAVSTEHIVAATRAAVPVNTEAAVAGNTSSGSAVELDDSHWAFRFTKKSLGGNDYGNCQGLYLLPEGSGREINKKPYYVREDGKLFLAWSGKSWEISSSAYLDDIKRGYERNGLKSFGGYQTGGGARPDLGEWSNYEVRREKIQTKLDDKTGFRFNVKGGLKDVANCEGFYWPANGEENWLNGKPYYVNQQRKRFMAWNNKAAGEAGGLWEITATVYLPQILQHHQKHGYWPGSFGGFHSGGGRTPDDGEWANYAVSPVHSQHRKAFKHYRFVTTPTGSNYALCDGVYTMAEGDDFELNGRPYFTCAEKSRFLAWTGAIWEITAMQYLEGVKKHHRKHGYWPGTFGGFHSGGGDWPDDGRWPNYQVTGDEPIALPDE